MNILVAGGAGYIGSHTVKQLVARGHQVVVLDNLSTGHRWAVRSPHFVEADIADTVTVRKTLQHFQVEAVVHFAACAYVGESVINPAKYYRNNVGGSLSLLDAMLDSGVRAIVFSSTCATYGIPGKLPIREGDPQAPINPYGETKLAVEKALLAYGRAYGLCWMALRYFNAAGADRDGDLGEDHDPETHLLPLAVKAALGQAPPVTVFGTDYPTADGTAVRDYIHVSDLADAHCRAVDYLVAGGESQALNLGTGRGSSVLEVLAAVKRVSGRQVPCIEGRRREGDPPLLVAAADRAYDLLAWRPQHPELDEIVRTAWQWHASRPAKMACASR